MADTDHRTGISGHLDRRRARDRRILLAILGAALATAAITFTLALSIRHHLHDQADHRCDALGARAISTNGVRYLCVTPDGRIVSP